MEGRSVVCHPAREERWRRSDARRKASRSRPSRGDPVGRDDEGARALETRRGCADDVWSSRESGRPARPSRGVNSAGGMCHGHLARLAGKLAGETVTGRRKPSEPRDRDRLQDGGARHATAAEGVRNPAGGTRARLWQGALRKGGNSLGMRRGSESNGEEDTSRTERKEKRLVTQQVGAARSGAERPPESGGRNRWRAGGPARGAARRVHPLMRSSWRPALPDSQPCVDREVAAAVRNRCEPGVRSAEPRHGAAGRRCAADGPPRWPLRNGARDGSATQPAHRAEERRVTDGDAARASEPASQRSSRANQTYPVARQSREGAAAPVSKLTQGRPPNARNRARRRDDVPTPRDPAGHPERGKATRGAAKAHEPRRCRKARSFGARTPECPSSFLEGYDGVGRAARCANPPGPLPALFPSVS